MPVKTGIFIGLQFLAFDVRIVRKLQASVFLVKLVPILILRALLTYRKLSFSLHQKNVRKNGNFYWFVNCNSRLSKQNLCESGRPQFFSWHWCQYLFFVRSYIYRWMSIFSERRNIVLKIDRIVFAFLSFWLVRSWPLKRESTCLN